MTGGQAIVRSLEAEGVEVVFGYPGGVALPIFDALFDSKKIRTILPRHEQGGVHAADGYARASGKVGVAMVTSGPGATNTVTGIANAYMDSIPMVVFTAQVAQAVIGTDAFQESDITGITLPVTKHNYLVKKGDDLAAVIKEAFHIASTGRPGPVLIDVPVDVSRGECDFEYPEAVNLPGLQADVQGPPEADQAGRVDDHEGAQAAALRGRRSDRRAAPRRRSRSSPSSCRSPSPPR